MESLSTSTRILMACVMTTCRTPRGRSAPASSSEAENTVWRTSCVRDNQSQVTFDVRAFELLFRKPSSSYVVAAPTSDDAGADVVLVRSARGVGDRRASLVHDAGMQLKIFDQLDAAPGEQVADADADGGGSGGDGHTSRDEAGLSRLNSRRRGHSLVRTPVRCAHLSSYMALRRHCSFGIGLLVVIVQYS